MSTIDAAVLRGALHEFPDLQLDELEIFASIASTNTHLLTRAPPRAGSMHVAIADHQTSGRGRHYRRWVSPPGAGLCLSVAYRFAEAPEQLPSLTLVLGVAVIEALRRFSVEDVRLKWPNDIVANDGKLGGLLTEVQAGSGAGVTVVAGIGINVNLTEAFDAAIDSEWAQRPTDLRSIASELPGREQLAAGIVASFQVAMRRFASEGFAPFADAWRQHDWLRGRRIVVEQPERRIEGVAAGVDAFGALLVDTGREQTRVISGSIALADAQS